jgi:hypothetical protein
MGAWIDTLGPCSPNNKNPMGTNICDPGGAIIAPLLLGTIFPLSFFLWDNFYNGGPGKGGGMHKGVPSSISTGLVVGALEGLGVAGANFAVAGNDPNRWGSNGIMTSVWVGATLGGIAGFAFGEAVRPDPRKIAFVASGAGWGAAVGAFLGGGAANSDPASISQGMLVGNLVGTNLGLAATGSLAALGFDPSWKALKYMWLGGLIGLIATSPIYLIYVFEPRDGSTNCDNAMGCPRTNHGMFASSLGVLGGIIIAGIVTRDMRDPDPEPFVEEPAPNGMPPPPGSPVVQQPTAKRAAPWTPPFTPSFGPINGGGMMSVSGVW